MKITLDVMIKLAPCPLGYKVGEKLTAGMTEIDRDDFYNLLLKNGHPIYAEWLMRTTNTLRAVLITGGVPTGKFLTISKDENGLAKLEGFEATVQYRDERLADIFEKNKRNWFAVNVEKTLDNGNTMWKPIEDLENSVLERNESYFVFDMYKGIHIQHLNKQSAIQFRQQLIATRMQDYRSAIFKEYKNPDGDAGLELVADVNFERSLLA